MLKLLNFWKFFFYKHVKNIISNSFTQNYNSFTSKFQDKSSKILDLKIKYQILSSFFMEELSIMF